MSEDEPGRPVEVVVGPFTWTVEYSDEVIADNRDTDGKDRFGITAARTHRITVAVMGRPEQAIREVVVHELLHAINITYSIGYEDGDDKEEQAVAALAAPLLEVVQRNPTLLRWLAP